MKVDPTAYHLVVCANALPEQPEHQRLLAELAREIGELVYQEKYESIYARVVKG